jgi:hypothetical protein
MESVPCGPAGRMRWEGIVLTEGEAGRYDKEE